MQGSFDIDAKQLYIPVEGGIATFAVEGASGDGYFEGGARIYYSVDEYDSITGKGGGITGVSWYTEDRNSPFYNYTPDQLNEAVNHFLSTGEMNYVFTAWGNKEGIDR